MSTVAESKFLPKLLTHPRALFFFAIAFAAVAAISAPARWGRPEGTFALKILRIENVQNSTERAGGQAKRVTMELSKHNPKPLHYGYAQKMQVRIAGRWHALETFRQSGDVFSLLRTNREDFVVIVPSDAEACRLLLEYRVGGNAYCRAYGFLLRHGLYQKVPKLCRLALKCFPRQPRQRHAELELMIPMESPKQTGRADRRRDCLRGCVMQEAVAPPPAALAIAAR